jgi:hypothetical protein
MSVDWSQVATGAVAVLVPLAPYLQKAGEEVAKEIGKAVWEKGKAIYQAIRGRFEEDKDEKGQATLKLFLEDSQTFEQALARLVSQKAQADPAFGKRLQDLVQDAMVNQGVVTFLNNFYGEVRAKNIVQIGTAGVVHID